MRVYYDWEFWEDGRIIDAISLGMVREDGKEYYAISSEFDQRAVRAHPWLKVNVLPYLPQVPSPYNQHLDVLDLHHPDVKGLQQIAAEVKEFVLGDTDPDDEPELWAYYGAYDHVRLCQLFGDMMSLPKGFPMMTKDIKQEMDRLGVTKAQLPQQGQNLHKAIDDARWNKAAHEFLFTREEAAQLAAAYELAGFKRALAESEKKREWLSDALKGFGI